MTKQDNNKSWWKGGMIYHIYPRSFQDTSGNGIGDLRGIIQRMDYIKNLGVNGLWISPFFQSPMKDFGYDVSDYYNVDPLFGTNQDLDDLIESAHDHGLKILFDLVLSHTSDLHPWFIESRESRDNPKADWYVWADPKPDGTPPNNWLSHFGGSCWHWDPRREQYYLHNFLIEQPDLNLHNKDVQQAMLDVVQHYLDKGVDGFRLDVVDYYMHAQSLQDNPAKPPPFKRPEPYFMQHHIYNRDQLDVLPFLKKIRALCDRKNDVMIVAEVSEAGGIEASAKYISTPDLLHTSYNFSLLSKDFSPRIAQQSIQNFNKHCPDGWPSWSFSNHDAIRVATRWKPNPSEPTPPSLIKMINALLLCLPGTIYIYQGQELGFEDSDVPFEKLQDPYGIAQYPKGKGRDGCRTPIAWNDRATLAGFSEALESWLPIDENHKKLAVNLQEKEQKSYLNHMRHMIEFRKNHQALCTKNIEFIEVTDDCLIFERRNEDEKIICIFNFSDQEISFAFPNQILQQQNLIDQKTLGAYGYVIGY